jgi:hypothetical protein
MIKMNDQIATDRKGASAAQTQLDNLVVNIELTLISIIQGVALSFLADHSREVLANLQLTFGLMLLLDCLSFCFFGPDR